MHGPGKSNVERISEYLNDRDMACFKCGYNLRGLISAVCPECGTGIQLQHWYGGDDGVEAARMAAYLRDHDLFCKKCSTNRIV